MKRMLTCMLIVMILVVGVCIFAACNNNEAEQPSTTQGCDHDYILVDAVSATCEGAGSIEHYHCSKCQKDFDKDKVEISDLSVAALGHQFGSDWVSADGKHYHICANGCGTKSDEADCGGGNATCNQKAVCSVCEKEYGVLASHNFTTTQYDENGHWQVCSNCQAKSEVSAHNFENSSSVVSPTCTQQGYTIFTCACGYSYNGNIVDAQGHQYGEWQFDETNHWKSATCGHDGEVKDMGVHQFTSTVVNASCMGQGYTEYVCTCGYSFKDNYVDAQGHQFAQSWAFDDGYHWKNSICGHESEKAEYSQHEFTTNTVQATCEHGGYKEYICSCGYSYQADNIPQKSHTVLNWKEMSSELYDANSCDYVVVYSGMCDECEQVVSKSEHIEKHSFFTKVTTAATCNADGEKQVFCSREQCKYNKVSNGTIAYSDLSAHDWVLDQANSNDSLQVYACSLCDATKKKSTGNTATLTSTEINKTSEIELPNATIGFDGDIRDRFKDTNISVSADALTNEEKQQAILSSNLTEDQKQLVGDSTVYNFSLNTDVQVSELGGFATIKIPYVLNGQDPNNIIVWYIDDGKLESFPAVYEQNLNGEGFVSFKTNHFSYYTVAQVSPQVLCKELGHDIENAHVIALTCLDNGYSVCARCGEQIPGSLTLAKGHFFQIIDTTAQSCAKSGSVIYKCADCDSSYQEVIPAIGHNYVLTEQVTANCQRNGSLTYKCVQCDDSYTITMPQLSHKYIMVVVQPTCVDAGYTQKTCTLCGDTAAVDIVQATGHKFDNLWSSDANGHYHRCLVCGIQSETQAHVSGAEATEVSAQICTVCDYIIVPPLAHKHNLTKVEEVVATCVDGGNKAYYVCECGKWFLDENAQQLITNHEDVLVSANGHTYENMPYVAATCEQNGFTSGVRCSVCQIIIKGHVEIEALGHDYIPQEIAATCESEGCITYKCANCGGEKQPDTIPALGHKFDIKVVNPTCTENGYILRTCLRCGKEVKEDETNALGHLYSNDFECDENGHWNVCLRCETPSQTLQHNPDYAQATLEHGVTCLDCGYVIQPMLVHTHKLSVVQATEPTCEKDGNLQYYVCECGKWFFDENAQNLVENPSDVVVATAGHNFDVDRVVPPTCVQEGYTYKQCSVCGEEKLVEVLPTIEHNFVDGYCTVCQEADPNYGSVVRYTYQYEVPSGYVLMQFYSDGVMAADIYIDGENQQHVEYTWFEDDDFVYLHSLVAEDFYVDIKLVRNQDGKTLSRYVHDDHNWKVIDELQANCQYNGYVSKICLDCGESFYQSFGRLEHNFVNGVCEMCGEIQNGILYTLTQEVGDAKMVVYFYSTGVCEMVAFRDGEPQSYGCDTWAQKGDTIYVTHEDDGLTIVGLVKVVNGELIVDICENGHEFEYNANEPSTCITNGFIDAVCKVCGVQNTGKLPLGSHNYIDGVCSVCGDSQGTIPPAKVVYRYIQKDDRYEEDATFYADGMGLLCSRVYDDNGAILEERQLEFKWFEDAEFVYVVLDNYKTAFVKNSDGTLSLYECEHEYVVISEVQATCTKEGYKIERCEKCGSEITTYYGRMEHVFVDGVCQVCGKSIDQPEVRYHFEAKDGDIEIVMLIYSDGNCVYTAKYIENGEQQVVTMNLDWKEDEKYVYVFVDDQVQKFIIGFDGSLTLPNCDHNYVETERTNATCTQQGYVHYVCENCGDEYYDYFYAEHVFVDGVCQVCGCGQEISHNVKYKALVLDDEFRIEIELLADYTVFSRFYREEDGKYQFISEVTGNWIESDTKVMVRLYVLGNSLRYVFTKAENGELIFDEKIELVSKYIEGFDMLISIGDDIDELLQNRIIGQTLVLTYSNGDITRVQITQDMIAEVFINNQEISYSGHIIIKYDNERYYIEVVVGPDLSNVALIGVYTIAFDMFFGEGEGYIYLYDNGIMKVIEDVEESPYFLEYTLDGDKLCMSVGYILRIDFENNRLIRYIPDAEIFGVYTFSTQKIQQTYTVYKNTDDSNRYIACFECIGGWDDGLCQTAYVDIDFDNMTFACETTGIICTIGENNTLICNHVIDSTITIYPTCTSDGSTTSSCKFCDETFTEIIPALGGGHNFAGGVCTRCGYIDYDYEHYLKLERERENYISEMHEIFSYLTKEGVLTEWQFDRFNEFVELMYQATSFDEMWCIRQDFEDFVSEVREYLQNENNQNCVIGVTVEVESISLGMNEDFDQALQNQLYGTSLYIYYQDGSIEECKITENNIFDCCIFDNPFDNGFVCVGVIDNDCLITTEVRVVRTIDWDSANMVARYEVNKHTFGFLGDTDILLYDNGFGMVRYFNEISDGYIVEQVFSYIEYEYYYYINVVNAFVLYYVDVDGEAVAFMPDDVVVQTYTFSDRAEFTIDVYGGLYGINFAVITGEVEGDTFVVTTTVEFVDGGLLCGYIRPGIVFGINDDFTLSCGHNFIIDEYIDFDCYTDGYISKHCDFCAYRVSEVIPAAHRFDDNGCCTWCGYDAGSNCEHNFVLVDCVVPTCQNNGYNRYVCEYCNKLRTEWFDKYEHNYDQEGYCVMCGKSVNEPDLDEIKQQAIQMVNNRYVEFVNKYQLPAASLVIESVVENTLDNIEKANSIEEVNNYYGSFVDAVEKIEFYISSQVVEQKYQYLEFVELSDVDNYIAKQIVGLEVTLVYLDGKEIVITITQEMITWNDLDSATIDGYGSIGIKTVIEDNYVDFNLQVAIKPNLSDVQYVGDFVYKDETWVVYDRYTKVIQNDSPNSAKYYVSELDGDKLNIHQKLYRLDLQNYTVDIYIPYTDFIIGEYCYINMSENVNLVTIYGEYTTADLYYAVVFDYVYNYTYCTYAYVDLDCDKVILYTLGYDMFIEDEMLVCHHNWEEYQLDEPNQEESFYHTCLICGYTQKV